MNPFENENGQENDEIAKIYAMADLKTEHWKNILNDADRFYKDFKNVSVKQSISRIKSLIRRNELTMDVTISLIDNMIRVYEQVEEYEKCGHLLKIKKGL